MIEVGAGPRRYRPQNSSVSCELPATELVEDAGVRESERGRCFTFSVSVFLSLGAAYWHTVTEIERPLGGLVDPPLREEEYTFVGLPLLNRSLASLVPSPRPSSLPGPPPLPRYGGGLGGGFRLEDRDILKVKREGIS